MVRLIAQLLRPYRWFVLIVLVSMLVWIGMQLLNPLPFKIILDTVGSNLQPPQWMNRFLPMLGGGNIKIRVAILAAAIVVLIAVVSGIAGYINVYFSASVGQWVGNDLRIRMYHHLQRLSLSYFHTHQVGAILSTVTDDVLTIQSFVSLSLPGMAADLLMI